MPYTKSVWVAGVTVVDAARQNNLETQYDEAGEDSVGIFLFKQAGARFSLPGWSELKKNAWAAGAPTPYALHLVPVLPRILTTYDRIACRTTIAGAGGTLARMGIYNASLSATGLVPTSLVVDGGSFAIDGGIGEILTVIAQALKPQWYFVAFVTQDGTFRRFLTFDQTNTDYKGPSMAPISGVSAGTNAYLLPEITLLTAANPGADWPTNGLPDPCPAITSTSFFSHVLVRDSS